MAGKAANRVNFTVSTTGTGSPFTAATVVSGGFQPLSVLNVGDVVEYSITDTGSAWEDGWGVVGSSGTITRNVFDSSNSGSPINLSGSATCIITLTAQGAQAILTLAAQRLAGGL